MTRLSHKSLIALVCGLSLAASPTAAQERTVARPVGDRQTVTLDPAKAYLLVESEGPVMMTLIREPNQAERDQWVADRAEALARAQRRHAGQLRRYQAEVQATRGRGRQPERPVEPTDANFQFEPIELRLTYSFGPQNRFSKASGSVMLVTGRSVYLTELPAGRYHVYGPVMMAPNGGAFGTCLCMGTVSFDIAVGQITDLGQVTNPAWARTASFGEGPVPPQSDPDTAVTVFGIDPARAGDEVDPRLRSYTIAPAQLRPGRRFANWFGLTVDRITPIPGVLSYRRDVMIDLTEAGEVPAAARAADGAAPDAPQEIAPGGG